MPFLLLMPSYNQARYIGEAVHSCLAQDDPDWQLWILDNSTDETPAVMHEFRDPRIRFIHEAERMDPGSCLNRLLELATGTHFSYVHTDNRLRSDYVRVLRAALVDRPLALAYCDYIEIDAAGRPLKRRRRPRVFPRARLFSADSLGVPFAATTQLAREVGGFSSDDLADDAFFVMCADGLGPRTHVPKPLVEYRVHDSSRVSRFGSLAVTRSMYRSAIKAYRLRRPELPQPFAGMDRRIHAHVSRATRAARALARPLLARVPPDARLWIRGTDPAAFWLAWACTKLGRTPAGFVAEDSADQRELLLGLPVVSQAPRSPADAMIQAGRAAGSDDLAVGRDRMQPLRWLLCGSGLRGSAIRGYPAPIMASLLIPLESRSAAHAGPVWVRGGGAIAAYLAFGIESMTGLELAGWIAGSEVMPGAAPTLSAPPAGALVWKVPGASGQGIAWSATLDRRSPGESPAGRRAEP